MFREALFVYRVLIDTVYEKNISIYAASVTVNRCSDCKFTPERRKHFPVAEIT